MVREERLELSLLLYSELVPKTNAAAYFAIPAYFIKNFSFLDFQDAFLVHDLQIHSKRLLFAFLYKKEKPRHWES